MAIFILSLAKEMGLYMRKLLLLSVLVTLFSGCVERDFKSGVEREAEHNRQYLSDKIVTRNGQLIPKTMISSDRAKSGMDFVAEDGSKYGCTIWAIEPRNGALNHEKTRSL